MNVYHNYRIIWNYACAFAGIISYNYGNPATMLIIILLSLEVAKTWKNISVYVMAF